jgi:N-acetylglucosaminyl-diphospho-decaprenol L-rhamnosyltransferase
VSVGPRLTAIIVYFRTPAALSACLDGLRTQSSPPEEIVVVDNSSALDSLDEPPASGEDWTWIRAERNLGYGAACNLGARNTESDYLLFLNADVVLGGQACERLRSAGESDRSIGVVGPRIYGADGRVELSARRFPTVATGLLGRSSSATKLLAAVGRTPRGVSGALGSNARVDWVSGACMLICREAFEQVGGFDEGYWMYWEDADICRRLKARGWDTVLCTDAEGRHSTGSSGRSERTIEAFHASAARYYEQHVARSTVTAGLARGVLNARSRIMLHRHARPKAS